MSVRIRLDRWLSAPPDEVWGLVTEPSEMNKWSLAEIRGIDPGDGGGFGSVGALRYVSLPRPLAGITEVIEHADVPTRLVYRVVGTRAVRYHRAEIRLEAEGNGTRLQWDVDAVLPVAAGGRVVRRSIEPKLRTSLERLAEILRSTAGSPRATRAPTPPFTDDTDTAALLTDAADVIRALDHLASEMEGQGDSRVWFARVYKYVTEEIRDACERGEVTHVAWALRLVPEFHDFFLTSVKGPAEEHWREAFAAIAAVETTGGSAAVAFWRAIVAGARAHIEGDLPRVLADVYLTHYAGRCDYVRFRADYLLLASALQAAWKRIAVTVPPEWFPRYVRVLERALPPEATEFLLAKRFFDPLSARRDAFDRGRELVREAQAGA